MTLHHHLLGINMAYTRISFFLLGLFLLASCAQISSFQTGRTTPKNEGEFGASINVAGISEGFDGGSYAAGVLELWGKYGVGEKTDIGLKLSTGLTFVFDVKQQLAGDQQSKFALAVGGVAGGFLAGEFVHQFHLPLYLSLHPSDRIAWYLTPRYINQGIFGKGHVNYLGSSIGVLFGHNVKFGLDLSYAGALTNTPEGLQNSNLGVGLFNVGWGVKVPIR